MQPVEPASRLGPNGVTVTYLGMDVHAKSITWRLLDASEEAVRQGSGDTTTAELSTLVRELGERNRSSAGRR